MDKITLFDEAASIIRERLTALPTEQVPVRHATSRVLAEDIYAKVSVPPFNRTMMDGFAVSPEDLLLGQRVRVTDYIAAGSTSSESLTRGQAARVMTGAPVPNGAAAIVRFEWCEYDDEWMTIKRVPQVGESIQAAGSDGAAGKLLLPKGRMITEMDAAVLQTFGLSQVPVVTRPKATIFVTGSELVMDNETPLGPAQIYGTNDLLLKGALERDGIDVVETAVLKDDLEVIANAVRRASHDSDYIIVTGGVSVGDRDFTPFAIEQVAGELFLRKVLMRPGSPFVFAQKAGCSIFGLSGNPSACFVQYVTLIRPAIESVLGNPSSPFPLTGVLTHDVSLKPVKHVQIHRARVEIVEGTLRVDCKMAQSTGVISSFVDAGACVRFDESDYQAGDVIPIRLLRPL